MCACEPGFTCSRCAGTPFDPMYLFDEPDPLTEPEFAELAEAGARAFPLIMLGEDG